MSVKITDFTSQIKVKQSTATDVFLRFLLEDIDRRAFPVTPKRDGYLRNSPLKTVSNKKGQIKWVKRYAAAQEVGTTRGYPIRKYTTPGTGANYAEKSVMAAVRDASSIMKSSRLI